MSKIFGRVGRVFLVTFVILVFVALLHSLYSKIYHEPRLRAITDRLRAYDRNRVADRNDRVKALREKFAVNLGSLPTVRFHSIDARSKRSSDDREIDDDVVVGDNVDDDGNGINGDLEKERRIRRDKCLTTGIYLSEYDDYMDCRSICHVTDGVEYKYFSSSGKIINGPSARAGSYCLPTDASLCNENTSLLVYGKNNWRCLTVSRAFAGEGGNKIVVCNGSILDRATGIVWRDSISPNLRFSHIDELLDNDAPDGEPNYRFVCPPGTVDRLGNRRVESPLDRLHLLDNYCASLVPRLGNYIRPDFKNSTCICRETEDQPDLIADPISMRCVPNFEEFDSRAFTLAIQDSDCVETWSVKSKLDNDSNVGGFGIHVPIRAKRANEPKIERSEVADDFKNLPAPCGVSKENSADTWYPRIRRTRIPLFDRAVMSHLALREITADV